MIIELRQKSQITIPSELIKKLSLKSGDKFEISIKKGALVLTGHLGDVMKESASIALDYVKSNAKHFNIDSKLFEENDIHIHVPEGAVPKDGPSAGITMATAMVSALTRRKVRADVAMTGEITLRGKVTAVGGIKEKVLAAHRMGIKKVLLPVECRPDLDELPQTVKDDIEFVFISVVGDALKEALV